jgi:hypothetical protein
MRTGDIEKIALGQHGEQRGLRGVQANQLSDNGEDESNRTCRGPGDGQAETQRD